MKIQSPEQLFGVSNTSRKLVVMVHELVTIRLKNPIPNLLEFAEKVEEADYCPERNRGVIINTRWGTIIVHASLVQFQQVRDPGKINLLASFLGEAIRSEKEISFTDWLRSLPPMEESWE